MSEHLRAVMSVAYLLDASLIVSGGWDHTARVWDAATGKRVLLLRALGIVWSAAFSPDSKRIITSSGWETAALWDAASGAQIRTFNGHQGFVRSVAFSPDGRRILTGSS